jgi:streptogramin lyase
MTSERSERVKLRGLVAAFLALLLAGSQTALAQTFEFAFGTSGTGPGEFSGPTALVVDESGSLYVSDTGNHRVQVFLSNGDFARQIGSGTPGNTQGSGVGNQFNGPQGLALDGDGNLYIADSGNHQIVVCDVTDTCAVFAGTGAAGHADGTGSSAAFNVPVGVAFDTSGNLYVSETGSYILRSCDPSAQCTTVAGTIGVPDSIDGFGTSASFKNPRGLTVTPTGTILIADRDSHSIRQYDPASTLVTTILGNSSAGETDGSGTAAQFNFPRSVSSDETGRIYVADTENHRVAVYRPDAVFLEKFGVFGTGDGELNRPYAAFVNETRIFVADFGNARVQIFSRDNVGPPTDCSPATSAAIATARAYQKVTRTLGRECDDGPSQACLDRLDEQQIIFAELVAIQDAILLRCQ